MILADTRCRLEDLPRVMADGDGWWERVKGIHAITFLDDGDIVREIANIFKIWKSSTENLSTGLIISITLMHTVYRPPPPPEPDLNVSLVKKILIDDEKWFLYNNVDYKKLRGKWNGPSLILPIS